MFVCCFGNALANGVLPSPSTGRGFFEGVHKLPRSVFLYVCMIRVELSRDRRFVLCEGRRYVTIPL